MGYFDAVSDTHVRTILEALCDDENVYHKASDMALQLEAGARDLGESDQAICVQCKKAFSTKKSGKSDCIYHDGLLSPDFESDVWADNDEAQYGDVDTDEYKREFPDAFEWDCCGQDGTSTGCTKGPHRTKTNLDRDDKRLSEDSDMTIEIDSDENDESDME